MRKIKILLFFTIFLSAATGYYYFYFINKNLETKNTTEFIDDGKIHIAIDAGHGGPDPGAINTSLKIYEKNITRKLVDAIIAMADTSIYNVLQTRPRDSNIHRHQRVDLATKFKADLMISLHCNSLTGGFLKGFEINICDSSLASDNRTSIINPNKNTNTQFADTLSKNIGFAFPKMKNLGTRKRKDRIWVLYAPKFPSLIIEWGYINNKDDIKIIQDSLAHQILAKAVWHSIHQHFGIIKY